MSAYILISIALFQSQLFDSIVKNRRYAIGRPWIYTIDQVIFVMLKIVSAEVARKRVRTGIRVTKQLLRS